MNIEAMKQALEALDEIHRGNMTPMAEEAWNRAITALRQAIEQAEHVHAVNMKQERVDETAERKHMTDLASVDEDGVWGERGWVGLTDQEIHEIDGYEEDRKMYRFARAIEAKLKEKNKW